MKLFVMLSRVPFPLDKGDKLRAYHQLKELSKHHDIHLCCLADQKIHPNAEQELLKFCTSVKIIKLNKVILYFNLLKALFSQKPFQRWYFYQNRAKKMVAKLVNEINPDHIYCQLLRAADYVKNFHSIPKTLDYMDAFSKGVERRIDQSGWLKPIFRMEYNRLVRFEHLLFEYFEAKTIISEVDRNFIMHPKRNEIVIVPNGIDTEFFQPVKKEPEYDIVFVGNMSYPPNVEAAKVLVNEVLPQVVVRFPQLKVLLAGATPSKQVLALASDQVKVSGWLDDIRTAYANGKLFVAPLNIGTGLQNKLLEAMAMGKPCVTTSLVNGALKAAPDSELKICNSNEEFSNTIISLLNDENKREQLGLNARKFILENYSWNSSVDILEKKMKKVSDIL